MWHGAFIALHALAGVIAFGTGCDAVVRRRSIAVFWWSLVAMVVFLALAVGVEWSSLDAVSRGLFTGLLGLGGWMVWRASAARRMLRHGPEPVTSMVDATWVMSPSTSWPSSTPSWSSPS